MTRQRMTEMTFTKEEAELIVSCLEVRLLALRRKDIDGGDIIIERAHVLDLIKRLNAYRSEQQ